MDRLRPDLMLLDLYLPDEHGLKLVARLRDGHPPVDVIVITAAKDADSVRVAMQGGALHYLLKPFSFPVLRDKLLSYAQMRTRLSALPSASQPGASQHRGQPTRGRPADRGPGVRRAARHRPAGRASRAAPCTPWRRSSSCSARPTRDLSAAEVAERTGMSRATAQRYLSHLHEVGRVDIKLRYGSGGRPEHGYRWKSA